MTGSPVLDRLAASLGPGFDASVEQVSETDCPTCHGEGGYEVVVGGWDEPIYEGRECESCLGSGRAPVVAFTIRPAAPLCDAPKPQPRHFPTGGDTHEPDLPF